MKNGELPLSACVPGTQGDIEFTKCLRICSWAWPLALFGHAEHVVASVSLSIIISLISAFFNRISKSRAAWNAANRGFKYVYDTSHF